MLGVLFYITLSVVMGVISCFFGKRLYFPILMLTVFTSVITTIFSLFDITWKLGIAAVAAGIIAALFSVAFYKLGVFLLGAILGAGIGLFLFSILNLNAEWLYLILVLALAIILGLCALKCCTLFIMASTAYSGAAATIVPLGFLAVHFSELSNFIYADGMLSTMENLSHYLRQEFAAQYAASLFIPTLFMAIVGFLVQYRAKDSANTKIYKIASGS